ncbi:MAG: GAF domain-containing protein [Anaerolineaceae bacterium]|nr:GAF domain-containing protein [Anaerolineaceae bacterium]
MTIGPFGLGSALILLALLLLGGAWELTRRIAAPRAARRAPLMGQIESAAGPHEALLVVQQGGHLMSMNSTACAFFHVPENETPNLEQLARRIRPGDAFLGLCAAEGQGRFYLDGRPVEGKSYRIASETGFVYLVLLNLAEEGDSSETLGALKSREILQTFTRFTQEIAASLDLESTLQSILDNFESLILADFIEITLWEPASERLVPYRFLPNAALERKLEPAGDGYTLEEGYAGFIARERKPLLIPNVLEFTAVQSAFDRVSIPIRSFLGVPLLVGQELIGTLELGSLVTGAYQASDLELVNLISGQAAIAIHNARLYSDEQRRTVELAGLAQLAQAVGTATDSQGLYTRLVDSIVPLVNAEVVGFLLFQESQRSLVGRTPFYGLPMQFVELYHVNITPGSQAEELITAQQLIVSQNAAEDPYWETLGLAYLAQAASMRESVLAPLTAGGRMLGYLQVSNHRGSSTPFNEEEIRLLTIVANQAAPIIENFTLITQTRMRAQRAEALRRIASLASSAATLDEVLQFSLQEMAHLLKADVAASFLVDHSRISLQIHSPSLFGKADFPSEQTVSLLVDDPQYPFTAAGSQHNLLLEYRNSGKPVIPFYQQIMAEWGLESVLMVPLIVRDNGIGEIWIASHSPSFFDQNDLQILSTAAGQLAGVVERSYLLGQTDEKLRRRVDQLTALTRISRELSASLNLDSLLQLVYDEAIRTTRADCGSIVLFDLNRPAEEAPRIRYLVGEHSALELSSFELEILEKGEPFLCVDVSGLEAPLPHKGVAGLMIVPVHYQEQRAGLILLHTKTPDKFDLSSLEIAQSLAAQATVAFGNAIQYEQQTLRNELLRREVDTLGELFKVFGELRQDHSLEEALQVIAQAIQQATLFRTVVISTYDEETGSLRRMVCLGLSEEIWREMCAHPPQWNSISQAFEERFKVGGVYFIPADHLSVIPYDVQTFVVLDPVEAPPPELWNPDDLLLVPLFNADQKPLGLISVDAPVTGKRPDQPVFEALDLFALQTGLVIDNHRQIGSMMHRLQSAESGAGRLEQSIADIRQSQPMLLRKDLEQTVTIHRLQGLLERMRSSMDIAVLAGQQADMDQILFTVASEILERFDLKTALLAETSASGPHLFKVIGNVPSGANLDALFGQHNPLRQVIQGKELLLAATLDKFPEWKNNSLLSALGARSYLGLPLVLGEERLVGILAVGNIPLPAFTVEDEQVLNRLSVLVGVALQNLELLNRMRSRVQELDLLISFSRRLAGLDPDGILNILLETLLQAIPEASAGWVSLWNGNAACLEVQTASGYQDNPSLIGIQLCQEEEAKAVALPLRVFSSGRPVRVAEIQFARDYVLSPEDLLLYRQATGGKLPVSSLIIPLRLGERILGVTVLDNFFRSAAFYEQSELLAQSLIQQAALALENARLVYSTEQRASQLQALTRVAGTITSNLRSDKLVESLLNELKSVLPYETATLWLRREERLTIAAVSGFEDKETRVGISLNIEDSPLFQEMITTGLPIDIADVRNDDRFPAAGHHDCLSWLAVPLITKAELMGVLALEKLEAKFYTNEHIQLAATFAGQAAISLENARLFEESNRRTAELDQRSQRLALLNRFSSAVGSTLDVDQVLKLAVQQLQQALNCSRAAMILLNENAEAAVYAERPPTGQMLPIVLPFSPLLERLRETQGIFSITDVRTEPDLVTLMGDYFETRQTVSVLFVPLIAGAALIGWTCLQTETPHHFSLSEIELARTISNQTAIAVQNARLYAETRSLTTDLEKRVSERTLELRREHQNTDALLRIITELSASLDMDQVLSRTLGVLDETLGAEQGLILAHDNPRVYRSGFSLGEAEEAELESLARNISERVTQSKSTVVVSDLANDGGGCFEVIKNPAYLSVLAAPLIVGEEILGALLLLHRKRAAFLPEQVGVIEAAAKQISVALKNAELFSLIRDQSENLGVLFREQELEANRSRGILEAVADGVLVTDSDVKITLFNASVERILRLRANEVIGESLEQLDTLFGKTNSTWLSTIQRWSEDPSTCEPGEVYAEQVELESGTILAIRLAPVVLRSIFMGTVSIFRDITREVQIDRMKAEFIANVSHELRTPMTSIKGYVDVMLMGASGELSSQQKRFLNIIKTNTERLGILVNDLLDVSRIDSGRLSLSIAPVRIPELAAEVVADISRRSREENREIQISIDAQPDLPPVFADADRVRQILDNLIRNSYYYTPEGGRVAVEIGMLDHELRIDIADSGIGIAPKDQRRIFERFFRGNDPLVLATAGNGLGLALSKTLVEMHGGRIWFESSGATGEGATFSFTLPLDSPKE